MASHDWLQLSSFGRWHPAETLANTGPQEIVDLNRDGEADYVARANGVVVVGLGTGGGSFGPLASYNSVNQVRGLAFGDVSGDGVPDAVASAGHPTDSTFTVLLGVSDGSFFFPVTDTLGAGVMHIALGDVNRDGDLDVAGGGISTTHGISVAFGSGAATFHSPVHFPEPGTSSDLSIVDLNADEKLDLLWVATMGGAGSPQRVSYRLGNGDGTFGAVIRLGNSVVIDAVQAADLNRDGRADLAWHAWSGSSIQPDSVVTAMGLPGGGFGPLARMVVAGLGTNAPLVVADFDENGTLDIVVVRETSRILYRGNGNGTFQNVQLQPGITRSGTTVDHEADAFDVDRDGHLDLVHSGFVVEYGNGSGTFHDADYRNHSQAGSGVTFAHMNGDALLDVMAVSRSGGNAFVFLNGGGGQFALPKQFLVAGGSVGIAAGDLNGDGRGDLVTTSEDSSTVSILLNNGTGTLLPGTRRATVAPHRLVRNGHFTADSNLDVVTGGGNPGSLSLFPGNGDGTFGARSDLSITLPQLADLSVADLNGDGLQDLAACGGTNATPGVLVLIRSGSGTFASPALYQGGPILSLAVGDYDEDGDLDIATASANQLAISFGAGDGTFSGPFNSAPGLSAVGLHAADVDLDTHLDLVARNAAGHIWFYRGDGNGDFELMPRGYAGHGMDVSGNPYGFALGDHRGDGRRHIACADETGGIVTFLVNRGPMLDPTPPSGFAAPKNVATVADAQDVVVGDFNRDGDLDVATAGMASNAVGVHLGNGDGTLGALTTFTGMFSPRAVAAGDLDHDGDLDLATVGPGAALAWRLGNGSGGFGAVDFTAAGAAYDLELADANESGALDALLVTPDTGSIKTHLGTGTGDFSGTLTSSLPSGTACAPPNDVEIADLNSDGSLDAVVAVGGCNAIEVRYGFGLGTFFTGVTLATTSQTNAVAVADVNRDGVPDLVSADVAGNVSIRVQTGAFGLPVNYTGLANASDVVCADMDLDGDLDIVVGSATLASFRVLKNHGALFSTGTTYATGGPSLGIAVADFNHDGVPDIVTANGGSNSVSIHLGLRATPTGVDASPRPARHALSQNRPNPFNPSTSIRFTLGKQDHVRLEVFNAAGRKVATLVEGRLPAGLHDVTWDGSTDSGRASSGVYFYSLRAGHYRESKRMVLLR